jgi:hypothetical protein
MDINTNFIAGKMNKSVDERLVPQGQYLDALNVRLGSTETTEIGAVENSKGNTILTNVGYQGTTLSTSAVCIGAFEDGVNENIYWFVHDPASALSNSGKVDMIMSYNTVTQSTTYHVISETVLNFNPIYLITGVDLIEDLLFFTDDYNAPRKINIVRTYPDPTNTGDQITDEDLNVIVKPPGFSSYTTSLGVTVDELAAPALKPVVIPGDENYIVDRFLCFAYRYQYLDNEYSATSLFTTSVFEPGQFWFDPDNYYNEGMENIYNAVDVTFNTGSKQVIAIELLYKESAINEIYVIERYKKSELGWPNNNVQTVRFSNSKIFSLLASDELLRWYDNVPRFAKAQTIMGNRLTYGNYIDQYDIVNQQDAQIPINFSTTGISKEITNANATAILTTTAQNILNPNQSVQVSLDTATFDLIDLGIDLPIPLGAEFNLQVKLTSGVSQAAPYNTPLGGDTASPFFPTNFSTNTSSTEFFLETRIIAQSIYTSYNDFLNSSEMAAAIGTGSTLTPITPGAVYGNSLSDELYKVINPPTSPVTYVFLNSGKFSSSPAQQGFRLLVVGDTFKLQAPAIQYQYDDGLGTIVNAYEYFSYSFTSITQAIVPYRGTSTDCDFSFSSVSDSSSLHSNRNYDASIMYMDEYGRSSTALVSPDNTVFFQASTSININTIDVQINNEPPYWATKYKFLLKPTLSDYNIIYSNEVYTSKLKTNISYVRLQGEATSLVAKGDILTVKIDSGGGAVSSLVQTTVLDVEALAAGDSQAPVVTPLPTDAPAGLYMKLQPQGYSAATNPESNVNIPYDKECSAQYVTTGVELKYPVHIINPDGSVPAPAGEFEIPVGSVVSMRFKARRGSGFLCNVAGFKKILTKASPPNYLVTATQQASNFRDFWIQENIDPALFMVSTGEVEFTTKYYNFIFTSGNSPAFVQDELQFYWIQDGPLLPMFLGIKACGEGCFAGVGPNKLCVHAQISININNNFMVFETKPKEADVNLFYDSSEMYNILPDINGNLAHQGDGKIGSQNQIIATGLPATVTLPFFDCFTFGNGVESFRYRDLSTTKDFALGERVTAVSNNAFAEADRFAGLTYSGVYSGSNNVNNLNEFNLGLVNFKDCELVFGPIMKLHARQTDILVLQEDRISYVLADKNLISDAAGGGAIITTPTILGNQIARIEEFGISFNPESFSAWGRDMYFSDTKRGAVLKLSGTGIKSDSLEVVSAFGMRSYFRDKFVDQLNTQKLGGYDPYMNEYVFSSNNIGIPVTLTKTPCGGQIQRVNSTAPLTLTIELGTATGNFVVRAIPSGGSMDINIVIDWNNNITTNNNLTSPTNIVVNKSSAFPTTATIAITVNDTSSYRLVYDCVETQTLNVVSVVLGSPISGLMSQGAQTINYNYNWTNGQFTSPTDTNLVTFSPTNNVSAYVIATGQSSIGMFPNNGANVTMRTIKTSTDTYTFNDNENRFYAIPTNAVPFSSGATFDLTLLTTPSTPITGSQPDTNGVDTVYQATSTALNITNATQTLYLVWDLRDRDNEDFCFSQIDANDSCTGCSPVSNCTAFEASLGDGFFPNVCNGGAGLPMRGTDYYHNGAGTYPTVGDTVWQTAGPNPSNPCSFGIIATPSFTYYYMLNGDIMHIAGNGAVIQILTCP